MKEETNKVSFSKEAGFYEEEFSLELSAPEGTIYYTLDGSIPDKYSIKYEKPIPIYDVSDNENNHSMRTDISVGFEVEAIEKINLQVPPGYEVPDYKVDKATIINAVVYDKSGNKSEVATSVYFVGYSQKIGYEGMNVLSIVTEPGNLFDYDKGIYVTGKDYDKYIEEYRNQAKWSWSEAFWEYWPANYRNRGVKYEKEAVCHFFNDSGALVLQQVCGIRIHGGHSRGYNPKSLNLYARKEYDGNENFLLDFWGDGYYPDKMTLFQGGNDYRTKAKDYLVAQESKELNVATMNYKPYVLFLNGEYWGVYWLNDKYDSNYIQYHYGVRSDNIIMIKQNALEEGEDDDWKYYDEMIEFCSESDLTNKENFNKACDMIDIESYVDYYALLIYVARYEDWPMSNVALWRTKKNENCLYGDGKWRWMVYDLNSLGFKTELNSVQYVMEHDKMFENMMTNTTFRQMLIEQIEETAEILNYEKMKKLIDEYRELMVESMKINDKRFFGDESGIVFEQELNVIQEFFKERAGYLLPILEQYK